MSNRREYCKINKSAMVAIVSLILLIVFKMWASRCGAQVVELGAEFERRTASPNGVWLDVTILPGEMNLRPSLPASSVSADSRRDGRARFSRTVRVVYKSLFDSHPVVLSTNNIVQFYGGLSDYVLIDNLAVRGEESVPVRIDPKAFEIHNNEWMVVIIGSGNRQQTEVLWPIFWRDIGSVGGAASASLFVLATTIWWRRCLASRSRRRLGLCSACGYPIGDLSRCPECGLGKGHDAAST